jgi:hypothetical protein
VQLHQLTPNAIVQIDKFVWAITCCGGHPTADGFTLYYELHYQNKKIHLQGSETTFAAQFGYLTFHLSQFSRQKNLSAELKNDRVELFDGSSFFLRSVGC